MGFIKTVGLLALSAALFGSAYSHQTPSASSDIQLHVFDHCNDWWLAVDPRGDGDDTVRVELQESGSSAWTELIHTPSWGYFHIVSHDRRGFDMPLSFRLTSSEGDQVTVSNLTSVAPGSDIDTGASWGHSTQAPTEAPTDAPTGAPTDAPTEAPTDAPTEAPTDAPTEAPTEAPTDAPTEAPTDAPTEAPTDAPTVAPTEAPTEAPTVPAVTTGRPASTGRPTTGRPATTGSAPVTTATTGSAPVTTATTGSTATSGSAATSTSGSSSGSTDLCSVPPTSSEPLKILVPLYSYPGAAWDNVVSAASSGAKIIAIINPSSGPIASGPDSTWTSYMNKLASAGVDMIGYIHTSYGTRSVSDVMAEVDTYASKYSGLKGVFLDEVSADASELSYYSQVYQHINGKSGFSNTILNPGAQPDQGYLDVSTSIVIFESPASSLKSSYASWVKCAPSAAAKAGYKYKFAGIAYGAGSGEISSVITTMQNAGMGLVYVTDGAGGCCTYNTLASYFASEASTVAALN